MIGTQHFAKSFFLRGVVFILFWGLVPTAEASFQEDLQRAQNDMKRMETELRFLSDSYRSFRVSGKVSLSKRLSDGQINFLLKDYIRASIILLDAVENPKNRGKYAWYDAVYYLAESLFLNRNYSGAKKYYDILVRSRRQHADKALVRLMEIAAKTKRFSSVNNYFLRGRQLPPGPRRDKIYYLRAKSLYNQGRLMQARGLFNQIRGSNYFGPRAHYFLAVVNLQTQSKKGIKPALQHLKVAFNRVGKDKESKKLRDILLLSLGRLHLELKQPGKALDYYRQIDRKSAVFDQSLYEVCWSYIRQARKLKTRRLKEQNYKRALQTLELLLAILPQSAFYPKAQLLQGHLQLQLAPFYKSASRSAYFSRALNSYRQLAKHYRGVYKEMDQLLKRRANPEQFFENLIARQLDQFRVASVLPKDAVRWMSHENLMKRTLHMLRDLRDMKKELRGNHQIIQRLESALRLGDQIDLSPSLKNARLRGSSIRSSLIQMQARLNRLRLALVSSKMTPEERRQYNLLQKRLNTLRLLFLRTPRTSKALLKRSQSVQKRIDLMMMRLHKITLRLKYATRFLKTLRRWIVENPDARNLTTSQRTTLRNDADQVERQIRALKKERLSLSHQLDLASIELGYASADPRERNVQVRYQTLLAKERWLLNRLKDRLSPRERQQINDLESLKQRLVVARKKARNFFRRLHRYSLLFRNKIRRQIAQEKMRLSQYRMDIAKLEEEAKRQASQIAYYSFASVRKKFYDLVLRAEVGVIDVAWREKQTLQNEKLNLTKSKNRELKVLDEEFRGLLQEVK